MKLEEDQQPSSMKELDFYLEDWKMAKDRIRHFDDQIVKLRLEGIPIASAIIGVALLSFQYTSDIVVGFGNFTINATSIAILMGAAYLLPIFVLDLFYYNLLGRAVKYAKKLEDEKFEKKIQITSQLTSKRLSTIHKWTARVIYFSVIITSIILAIAVNSIPSI